MLCPSYVWLPITLLIYYNLYDWTCEEVIVGVSSPVLYVTNPGVYHCLVTDTVTEGNTASSLNFEVISVLFALILQ